MCGRRTCQRTIALSPSAPRSDRPGAGSASGRAAKAFRSPDISKGLALNSLSPRGRPSRCDLGDVALTRVSFDRSRLAGDARAAVVRPLANAGNGSSERYSASGRRPGRAIMLTRLCHHTSMPIRPTPGCRMATRPRTTPVRRRPWHRRLTSPAEYSIRANMEQRRTRPRDATAPVSSRRCRGRCAGPPLCLR
jgi:hypothetical protein